MRPAEALFGDKPQRRLDLKRRTHRIGTEADPYMTRTHLAAIRLGRSVWQLRVHDIHRHDRDEHEHNHPFDFWSFVLRGWYVELLRTPSYLGTIPARIMNGYRRIMRGRFSLARRFRHSYHRIVATSDNLRTLVLVRWPAISPPSLRGWGFMVNGQHIVAADYFAHIEASRGIGGEVQ